MVNSTIRPDIYLYIATGVRRPNMAHIHSNIRKALDKVKAAGQHVFIAIGDGHIYEWRNFAFGPMFQTWDDFINFYKDEPIEFGRPGDSSANKFN